MNNPKPSCTTCRTEVADRAYVFPSGNVFAVCPDCYDRLQSVFETRVEKDFYNEIVNEIIDIVRTEPHLPTFARVADVLNERGYRTVRGRDYDSAKVYFLMRKYKLDRWKIRGVERRGCAPESFVPGLRPAPVEAKPEPAPAPIPISSVDQGTVNSDILLSKGEVTQVLRDWCGNE